MSKWLRSLLGLCSYYQRFIIKFSEIARSNHKLTEEGVRFKWMKDCSIAFFQLKSKLIAAPIMAHPDFSKIFILDVYACDQNKGAVILQKIDGGSMQIHSKKQNGDKRRSYWHL